MAHDTIGPLLVPTVVGDARVTRIEAASPKALLALGHGAGGGVEARDLQALAAALPPRGISVALVEQPWRVAGKRLAPAPKTLDTGWKAICAAFGADLPLVVGGRSAGARVACRTGRAVGAVAVLALAFPLHPPGKPEQSRADELLGAGLPTLVVQGERDPFGKPGELAEAGWSGKGRELVAVPFADHGFAVPKSAKTTEEETLSLITEAVIGWLGRTLAPGRR